MARLGRGVVLCYVKSYNSVGVNTNLFYLPVDRFRIFSTVSHVTSENMYAFTVLHGFSKEFLTSLEIARYLHPSMEKCIYIFSDVTVSVLTAITPYC